MVDRWTTDALFCDATKQDCPNCNTHKFYGVPAHDSGAWNACNMPEAIQMLKSKGIKKPVRAGEYYRPTKGKYDKSYGQHLFNTSSYYREML